MRRIALVLLLIAAGVAGWYGVAVTERGLSHWLFAIALTAGFFASDIRFWRAKA
jgi:hypothetical protein